METPLPIWIDPAELDELAQRYPEIPRAELAQTLERHWPLREEVEAAIRMILESGSRGFPRHATS